MYRLKGVALSVPDDERIADIRSENDEYRVPAHLVITWEPLSYRVEGGIYGNEERKYIPITKAGGLTDLDNLTEAEALEAVRAGGYPAIPSKALIKLDSGLERKDPARQPQQYSRTMCAALKSGMHVGIDKDGSVTGQPGNFYSKDVGKVFRCTNGPEDMPRPGTNEKGRFFWDWDDTYSKFMILPREELTNYVQPEDVPVRVIESQETTSAGFSGGGEVSGNQLSAAVVVMGLSGSTVEDVNGAAPSLIAANVANFPDLQSTEVATAAASGTFVEYLESIGALSVEDGVIA